MVVAFSLVHTPPALAVAEFANWALEVVNRKSISVNEVITLERIGYLNTN